MQGTILAINPTNFHRKSHHALLVFSIRDFNQIWIEIIHSAKLIQTKISQESLNANDWYKMEIQRRGHYLHFKINDQLTKTIELPRGLRLG